MAHSTAGIASRTSQLSGQASRPPSLPSTTFTTTSSSPTTLPTAAASTTTTAARTTRSTTTFASLVGTRATLTATRRSRATTSTCTRPSIAAPASANCKGPCRKDTQRGTPTTSAFSHQTNRRTWASTLMASTATGLTILCKSFLTALSLATTPSTFLAALHPRSATTSCTTLQTGCWGSHRLK